MLMMIMMMIYGRSLGLELEGLTWKNEWACLLVLLNRERKYSQSKGIFSLSLSLSLFREEKIIRLSAPTKHPK